ncbi:MAG: metal ABC transporter ATP-binding protein [Deinococcota bacterium]
MTDTQPSKNEHILTAPALAVRNLCAGYPGDQYAIDQLTFSVGSGERVALIGPNGAGKSTLFKVVAGLIPITHGTISIGGEDYRSSHASIGYIPQQNEIDWSFPVAVRDVIMMGRAHRSRWLPWWRASDHTAVQALLEQLNLTALANRQISQISGGQRRRVFIARALAQGSRVLLMDEPFTGVDTAAQQEIMNTLDVLTHQGITILLATHDMGRAARDFDRILLLKRHMLAFDVPQAVVKPDVLQQAYGAALTVFQEGRKTMFIVGEHGAEG